MKKINIYLLLIILLNSIVLLVVINIKNKHQIYLRNLMFSEIIADSTISNERELDIIIDKKLKTENKENLLSYLDQTAVKELSLLKNQYKGTDADRFLAISILKYLGENPTGKICGVPSLGKVVFDVEKGIGCCSDYTKAWMFYALYFGIQVREVNSLNHTTVEFYDSNLKKWIWLDPFNRAQFSMNNVLLNQYEARKATLFDKVTIINLNKEKLDVVLENYEGYNTSQLSLLLWRKGNNFIEVENWDAKLRDIKIPKPLRQLFVLTTGVSPGWIMLANDALASYLRILKLAIYLLMTTYFLINLFLLSRIYFILKHSRQTFQIKA
jgi:hypothetical protein